MKRNIIVAFSAIVLAGGTFFYANLKMVNQDTLLSANVEAMTQNEAEITCGKVEGPCYRKVSHPLFLIYKCEWTGRQSDVCYNY